MGERREKLIIAGVAVTLVYGLSAYAICGDAELCSRVTQRFATQVPGQFLLALLPTAMFSFFLAVDALLPLGASAIDMAHDALGAVHRHLFVDGERNGYWHLRIFIALASIAAVQLLASAVECLRGG